jgi:cysteine desulfurase/selenocysteine lyase
MVQAVPHLKPDMQALDCDFYVFSGHKLWATGTGILYGKEEWLNKLPHIKWRRNDQGR